MVVNLFLNNPHFFAKKLILKIGNQKKIVRLHNNIYKNIKWKYYSYFHIKIFKNYNFTNKKFSRNNFVFENLIFRKMTFIAKIN